MAELDDLSMMLGSIQTDLNNIKDTQKGQSEKIDAIDARLKNQEVKAAGAGAVGGIFVSVFASVLAYSLRGIGSGS